MRPRVAVIGGGAAGVAVTDSLLRGPTPPRIYLIDRKGDFGAGLAYGAAHEPHVLNAHASQMSFLPDDPDDFCSWIRNARDEPSNVFAKRRDYAAYVAERTRRWRGADVARFKAAAIAIVKAGQRWRVTMSSHEIIDVDAVILALGHPPPVPPPPFDAIANDAIYVNDPWSLPKRGAFANGSDILLIGAGLTAIDMALSFTTEHAAGQVYAISRRGLLPRVHRTDPAAQDAPPPALSPNLSEALRAVRRELAESSDWRAVVNGLRAAAPDLWRELSPDARRRFHRHLRPYWDALRHRTPPHVDAWLNALIENGRMHVSQGKFTDVRVNGGQARISYRPRGASEEKTIAVQRIINCTGPCYDVARWDDPLMRLLLSSGIARPHDLRLGFDVDESGALIGAEGAAVNPIYALGPLTLGAYGEIISIPEIAARAQRLAEHVLRTITAARAR